MFTIPSLVNVTPVHVPVRICPVISELNWRVMVLLGPTVYVNEAWESDELALADAASVRVTM